MAKTIKNYGRSVKERLLNISRAEKYSSQLLISRYFQERLLYRLSVSDYKDMDQQNRPADPAIDNLEKLGILFM